MSIEEEAPQWFTEARRAHEATLKAGTRVRVDIGECPYFLTWHGTIEQGETGVIIGIDPTVPLYPPDHRYNVFFDRPPIRTRASWDFSATELTPIPDPTPEEIQAEVLKRLARLPDTPAPEPNGG